MFKVGGNGQVLEFREKRNGPKNQQNWQMKIKMGQSACAYHTASTFEVTLHLHV